MSDDNPAATTDVKIPKRLRYEVLRRDRHTCRCRRHDLAETIIERGD